MPLEFENYKYCFPLDAARSKIIYVQSIEGKKLGNALKTAIKQRWLPPTYYFHFSKGGHVAATKIHEQSSYFLKIDIKNFFPSITRNKIIRDLRSLGYSYKKSNMYARRSTVGRDGKYFIPYGFTQSSVLSALALYNSRVGKLFEKIFQDKDYVISVYVDDIIISSNNNEKIDLILPLIKEEFGNSIFEINAQKTTEKPQETISVFNLILTNHLTEVTEVRLEEFKKMVDGDHPRAQAIASYVNSINAKQGNLLCSLLLSHRNLDQDN